MNSKTWVCAALLLAAGACGKKAAAPGAGAGEAAPTAAADKPAAPSAAKPADAGAAPVATAAGGEVTGLTAVTDCPKSLSGPEKVARTITKACGPVPVTGNYRIDGQLTLEAGAVLKFSEGTGLDVGPDDTSKLIVKGTPEEPVVMTSGGDAVAGFWRGVRLYSHAARSQIANLVIEHAGDDRGMLKIDAEDVSLKGLTLRDGKDVGLYVDDNVTLAELSGSKLEKAGKVAISATLAALGGLQPGNSFDADAFVEVRGGVVDSSAKWQNPGAPYVIRRSFDVAGKNGKATLEIAAGTVLKLDPGVDIDVGYSNPGALVVAGSADKPVTFTASEAGHPWQGVWIYNGASVKIDQAVLSGGGADEGRGVIMVDHGDLAVTNTAFKGNRLGVTCAEEAEDVKLAIDKSSFDGGEKPAVAIMARQVGGLGASNSFAKDAHIMVRGGTVRGTVTWPALSVPYEIAREVTVEEKGQLTLAAGVELVFAKDQQLSVGYSSEGTLKAMGTADKPVKLRGEHDEADAWKGVYFYGSARDSELNHVRIEGAGAEAAVQVKEGAAVKIDGLSGAKCANAVVTSDCKAKLTVANVKAENGTPKDVIKPECQ
jgi:hypothetical protein